MKNPIRMFAAFFTVGSWTLMSRIAGFARDIMIAAFFGAGPIAEAFAVAFSLPNMFRRFFAEGAFNMAFIPMFSKKLESGDAPEDFAREAFAGLATVLIALTIIATLAMPWLVLMMASGFAGDERFDLAVDFGRICFPYILFISLAALCSGVLNATGRFAAAAAAPVLLNIVLVGAMTIAYLAGADVARALVWGVPIAGIAQLALVWYAARGAGIHLIPRLPRLSPDMKRLALIALPAMLAGGVMQINLLVGRQVASYFDGAIQWLWVADRVYQLPLGVVGIAIGVVLLPDLSRRLQADDTKGGQDAFNRATEFSLFLTVPAAAAMIAIPLPMVSVLFERGAFTAADSQNTATALAIYGAGLPAFVLQKVLQPLFFAREDTKTPFYLAVVAMVINAALAIGLAPIIGFEAAAWGTTLSAWAMVILLWWFTRKMGLAAELDARLVSRVPRILAASAVMGLALFGINQAFFDSVAESGLRYLFLAAIVALGMVIYFVAAFALHAITKQDFKKFLRRS